MQSKAKGDLGHSFTFPCQLDFLKEKANVAPYTCIYVPPPSSPKIFDPMGHFGQIWQGVRSPKKSCSLFWEERRHDREEVPKGGDTTVWADSIRHQGRSTPSCHYRGRSFSQILQSTVGHKWVTYFCLSGAGAAVYKITKSRGVAFDGFSKAVYGNMGVKSQVGLAQNCLLRSVKGKLRLITIKQGCNQCLFYCFISSF